VETAAPDEPAGRHYWRFDSLEAMIVLMWMATVLLRANEHLIIVKALDVQERRIGNSIACVDH
jgi:hypothetical protein